MAARVEPPPRRRCNRLLKGISSIPLSRYAVRALMAARTLEDWVDALQAHGRYTFLRAEAVDESGLSAKAVKKALQRLAGRGRVTKVKDYFYVIVPLEYRAAGGPPPSWFIHDLMGAMHLPYYLGLLSAASLQGASHQRPQEFQVVTLGSPAGGRAGADSVLCQQVCCRYGRPEHEDPDGFDARFNSGGNRRGPSSLRQGGWPSGQRGGRHFRVVATRRSAATAADRAPAEGCPERTTIGLRARSPASRDSCRAGSRVDRPPRSACCTVSPGPVSS